MFLGFCHGCGLACWVFGFSLVGGGSALVASSFFPGSFLSFRCGGVCVWRGFCGSLSGLSLWCSPSCLPCSLPLPLRSSCSLRPLRFLPRSLWWCPGGLPFLSLSLWSFPRFRPWSLVWLWHLGFCLFGCFSWCSCGRLPSLWCSSSLLGSLASSFLRWLAPSGGLRWVRWPFLKFPLPLATLRLGTYTPCIALPAPS